MTFKESERWKKSKYIFVAFVILTSYLSILPFLICFCSLCYNQVISLAQYSCVSINLLYAVIDIQSEFLLQVQNTFYVRLCVCVCAYTYYFIQMFFKSVQGEKYAIIMSFKSTTNYLYQCFYFFMWIWITFWYHLLSA